LRIYLVLVSLVEDTTSGPTVLANPDVRGARGASNVKQMR
jgi:hypothetical protein